ncbi:MAG: ribbon-helix-helix domain-containing protein [Candidatus Woesearchaeota archaeon]|nr:ribbon-helix-helix domain-containing protein [Candidatus Woesearchaeota archaeon]
METVSFTIEKKMLDEIDSKLAENRYSTRTEFIRDAIRKELSHIEKEELIREFAALRGSSKLKTTDAQLHAAGEAAFEELEKHFTK